MQKSVGCWGKIEYICGRGEGTTEPQGSGSNSESLMPLSSLAALLNGEQQDHGGRITMPPAMPANLQHAKPQEGGSRGRMAALATAQPPKTQEQDGGSRFTTLQSLPTTQRCPKLQPAGARRLDEEKNLAPA